MTFKQGRIAILERRLLACFNDEQQIEGFTVDEDSDVIYEAKNGKDELFLNWLADCSLEDALKYNELLSE